MENKNFKTVQKSSLYPLTFICICIFLIAGAYVEMYAGTSGIQQQNKRTVTGLVTDSYGEVMPGVTISIRGTSQGVITNPDGEYSITVPSDTCTLRFSFIGYKTEEVVVGKRRIIPVTLSEDVEGLDEVVIVGFGKQKKVDVIGSVVSLNMGELKKVSSSNITTMMAGNIAGMISYQRSGEPGADNADFFIRGVTTFGYKKDPLILVDGIEVTATDLARLQPDDIANFSIMKEDRKSVV